MIDRRRILALLACSGAFAGISARAQSGGPPIWNGLDQKQLDDAYDQSVFAPNAKLVSERRTAAGRRALEAIGEPERLSYGPTRFETLDLYRAKNTDRPALLIFLHGGAWKSSDARKDAFLAEMFVKAGVTVVMPNFAGAEDVGGDLMVISDQVRRATAFAVSNALQFGADPSRLFLIGHSSGAHLGGVLLTTDWAAMGLPAPPFRAALLGSGMYDLHPVRLSKRSSYLKITDQVEQELSPQRHISRISCPITLTYGLLETPEFQRQSRDFHAALLAAGRPVRLMAGEALNHFETQETLASPYGFMGRPAIAMLTQ